MSLRLYNQHTSQARVICQYLTIYADNFMTNKTHYENLKVARDAPSDVIRAAYKALTHKHNLNRNPNAETQKLLEIINASNAVLSNPVKRAEYDQWLLEQESAKSDIKKPASTSKSNQKVIQQNLDDNEIIIGKDSDVIAYKNNTNIKRWLIYLTVGLITLLALFWMFSSSNNDNNETNQSLLETQSTVIDDTLNQTSLPETIPKTIAENTNKTQNSSDFSAIDMPMHDKAGLDKFIGTWTSESQTSTGLYTLEITKKSDNTVVFQLNAKAGQSAGAAFGIADFNNSYALFFNEEYDCSILFTIKSNMLQVTTNSCQEYHKKGVSFDGFYTKPTVKKVVPASEAIKTIETEPLLETTPEPAIMAPVIVKKQPKLYKFMATVKDADGNVSEIELIAKDKDAAIIIIRDFRGNPEVLKLKQLKK